MGGSLYYKMRRGSRPGGLGLSLTVAANTRPLVCTITCIVLLLSGSVGRASVPRDMRKQRATLANNSITSSNSMVITLGT